MAERTLYVGDTEQPSRVIVDPQAIDCVPLQHLLDYWRKRRTTDSSIPDYSQFRPRELGKDVSAMVVADALPGYSDFRYRLVGARVMRYFLSDATGKTIREEFGGQLGDFLTAINRQACLEGCPVRLTGPAAIIEDVLYPNFDALYVPFAIEGVAAKVVSMFSFDVASLNVRGAPAAQEIKPLALRSGDDLIRPLRDVR